MDAGGFARFIAAWTSHQSGCEGDDQVSADRRDRVYDVSFGTDGRRFGVDNFGKRQTSRIDWPRRRLRGNPRPFGDQEGIGGKAQGGVMVEAAPAASFVMSEAQFLFQLLVIALDAPAQLG